MALAPAHVAAIGLAAFGFGLIFAAFAGEGFGPLRLAFGIAFVVAAFITAGFQVLNHHGASYSLDREEA